MAVAVHGGGVAEIANRELPRFAAAVSAPSGMNTSAKPSAEHRCGVMVVRLRQEVGPPHHQLSFALTRA